MSDCFSESNRFMDRLTSYSASTYHRTIDAIRTMMAVSCTSLRPEVCERLHKDMMKHEGD